MTEDCIFTSTSKTDTFWDLRVTMLDWSRGIKSHGI
jgi:hypothetical protein